MRLKHAMAGAFALALAIATSALGAGTGLASVATPAVQGPIEGGIHGYPYNHSLFPLTTSAYSYTENEYFFSGNATNLEKGISAPYTSRMLVRLPIDPKKFNGTVMVEWVNVTGQKDIQTSWPVVGEYLMHHGYGFAVVDAQLAGDCCGPTTLKGWDPVRYAPIVHPPDEFAFDIFSQAIRALRHPNVPGVNPMRGMKVKHIVAGGASQSATELTTFINSGYNRGEIDAYAISRLGGPFTDFSTPIWHLNGEVEKAPQPDNGHYRAWEEAGAAHDPKVHWSYVEREEERDFGVVAPIEAGCSINRSSVDYSARAQVSWIAKYFKTGNMGPSMPRQVYNSAGELVRDSAGLAEGGVRQPFIQVPVAYNAGTGCPLWGTYRGWTPAMIESLYPTHAAYVGAVKKAAAHDVTQGSLLPEDAKAAIAKAESFTAPWTLGSCYETGNPKGEENGVISGAISSATWNPTFLTLGNTAPLGGFDAATHNANCTLVVDAGF
jgi:Alpha/beta hydrolase domain